MGNNILVVLLCRIVSCATNQGGENDTWWSVEEKGNKAVFHQFKSNNHGTYHWAGSTGSNVNRKGFKVKPVSTSIVPVVLKRKVGFGG